MVFDVVPISNAGSITILIVIGLILLAAGISFLVWLVKHYKNKWNSRWKYY